MSRHLALAALLGTLALLTAPAAAQDHTVGDLHLYGTVAGPEIGGALARIDPLSGNADVLATFDVVVQRPNAMAWDSYRKRPIFCARPDGADLWHTWTSDGAGNLQDLGNADADLSHFAPRGDGLVYAYQANATNTTPLRYIDGANRLQTLMDATGTTPYFVNNEVGFDIRTMTYDPLTNALFVASRSAAGTACPGGSAQNVAIRKIPLAADGTRVDGAESCAEFDVFPGQGSELPKDWGRLPNGDLLLIVDVNGNATLERMVRIDPVTLATSGFAANGGYTFTGVTEGGTYSAALGKAVLVDAATLTILRAWAAGENGAGTVVGLTGLALDFVGSSTLDDVVDGGCSGAWRPYGTGLAGTGGRVPTLIGRDCPEPGGVPVLEIRDVVGGAPAALFLGTLPSDLPFKGGALYVAPILVNVGFTMPGTPGVAGGGEADIPLPLINDPGIAGVSLFFQVAFGDPEAPANVSLTQGLELVIG